MAGSTLKRSLTFTVTSALLAGGALASGCASQQPEIHVNPGPDEEKPDGQGEETLTAEPDEARPPKITNTGPALSPEEMGGGTDGGEGGTDGGEPE